MSFSAAFKFLHTVLCRRKNLYYENKTIGFSLFKVLMKISTRFIFQLVQTSTRISKISKLKFSAAQSPLYIQLFSVLQPDYFILSFYVSPIKKKIHINTNDKTVLMGHTTLKNLIITRPILQLA